MASRYEEHIKSGGTGTPGPPITPGQDKFAPKYIVGNVLAGDPVASTPGPFVYIADPGDCSGIALALTQAEGPGDVWIRPGTYDLGAGAAGLLTIPAETRVTGSGPTTVIRARASGDRRAFVMTAGDSALRDLQIVVPVPTGASTGSRLVDASGGLLDLVTVLFEGPYDASAAANESLTSVFFGSGDTTAVSCRITDAPALVPLGGGAQLFLFDQAGAAVSRLSLCRLFGGDVGARASASTRLDIVGSDIFSDAVGVWSSAAESVQIDGTTRIGVSSSGTPTGVFLESTALSGERLFARVMSTIERTSGGAPVGTGVLLGGPGSLAIEANVEACLIKNFGVGVDASSALSDSAIVLGNRFRGCTVSVLQNGTSEVAHNVAAAAPVWTEQQKLVPSTPSANDNFGTSVAISDDTIISGAWRDNALAGSAYIYTRTGGVWTEQQKITGSDTVAGNEFGRMVAIDGDTVVCGASIATGGQGAAYVFTRTAGVWTEQQKLTEPIPTANSFFGEAVAINGDTLAVSSRGGLPSAGVVYVFTRTAGVWTLQQTLTPTDPELSSLFGSALAIDGDTLIAGRYLDDGVAADEGSAYVFTRTAGVWTQQQKLVSPTPALSDQFGRSVSLSGETVVVGCPRDDQFVLNGGAAFVFTRAAGVWSLQQKITAADPVADDRFGSSVGLDGNLLVVGAPLRDSGAVNAGSIYTFGRIGSVWTQQARLDDPAPSLDDRMGTSVSISGATVVAGAPFDDASVGSAYVFVTSG